MRVRLSPAFLRLPRHPPRRVRDRGRHAGPPARQGLVIVVVVEDEVRILELCTELLLEQGHEVHGFLNGAEALVFLAGHPADVLVADYRMPGMNGDELLQRAREHQPSLPAVMMTGQGTAAVVAAAKRGGFAVVLAKPFTPQQLAQALARAVASDSARC